MLNIWYTIAFWFDSHLGDFPFFKTFQRARFAVTFRVSIIRLGLRLRLGLGFIFYVYFVFAKPIDVAILAAK